MRRRKLLIAMATLLGALGLYVTTFSYWWLRSPSKERVVDGETVHVVHFTNNKISYYTGPIWIPAFWTMEHIFGYEHIGLIAMYEDSVYIYTK